MLEYVASGEQIQCFDRHLGGGRPSEVMMIDSVVRDLDAAAMKKAIEVMIRRHESLRTFFRIVDDELKQCIIPYDEVLFGTCLHDMSAFDDRGEMIGAIRAIIAESKSRLSELTVPPLMRSHIFKTPGDEHFLCILIHHIISDERSKLNIYREISTFYQLMKDGKPFDIQPLGLQLRDYALWQKKWQEENYEQIRGYWTNKLLFLDEDTDPGGEKLLDALNTGRSAIYSRCFDPMKFPLLSEFSISHKSSMCSVIIASLQLLFYYLGEKKILIAMPVSGRSLPGVESLIGYLVGNVYLYRSVVPDMPIRDFIREGYQDFLESASKIIYDHRKMNIDGRKIRLNSNIHLSFINKEFAGKMPTHIEYDNVHHPMDTGGYFGLNCTATEFLDGLSFLWSYNQALYSPERVAFMAEKQEAILEAICRNPGMTTKELITSVGAI